MDKKRVWIATALSIAVVVVWLKWFAPRPPEPPMGPPAPPDWTAERPSAAPPEASSDASGEVEAPADAGTPGRIVRVRSDLYDLEITATGGALRSLRLLRHRVAPSRLGESTGPVELVSAAEVEAGRLPLLLFTGEHETDRNLQTAAYRIDGAPEGDVTLAPGERRTLVLRWSDGAGLSATKTLELDGASHRIGLEVVARAGGRPVYLFVGSAVAEGAEATRKDAYTGHAALLHRGKVLRPTFSGRAAAQAEWLERLGPAWPPAERDWLAALERAEHVTRVSGADWAAADSSYFAAIAYAAGPLPEVVAFPVIRSKEQPAGMALGIAVTGGKQRLELFLGPKDHGLLGGLRADLARVVNFGWFETLSKALFHALRWCRAGVGNYGLAIILLTVVIKIAFLPLTIKQLHTMQKMARIQPQVKAINERYARVRGDARERAEASRKKQQELMALYSREGVNPMGGCLPLLLYLPFLWGFYAVLGAAIELRQAPFVLWVQDLSAKDPLYVTPVLMMVSMIVQQAITPNTMDPVQRRIMYIVPVFMTWVFKDLASGLVLFWLTNNVLTIVQQGYMNRLTRQREAEEKRARRKGGKGEEA